MRRTLAIAFLIGACSGGGGDTPDAASSGDHDAADVADVSTPIDAATTRVRVVVFGDQNLPVFSTPVLFQRADGTVVADVMTDFKGAAEVDFPTGGSVTVFLQYQNDMKGAITYLDVHPGDVLEIGDVPAAHASAQNVTMQLPPGSPSYQVSSPCNADYSTTPSVSILIACSPQRYLVSSDAGRFYTDELTVASNSTVDLTAQTFRRARSITLHGVNAPPPSSGPHFATGLARIGDRGFVLHDLSLSNTPMTNGTGDVVVQVPDLPNIEVTTRFENGSIAMMKRALPEATVAFDFAQTGVPTTTNHTFAAQTFGWTEQGSGGGDLVRGRVQFGPLGSPRVRVDIIGPKTGTTLAVPVFPAPYDDRNQITGENVNLTILEIVRLSGGWDAAREKYFRDLTTQLFDWFVGDVVISR